jgi:hypothetical protein
VVEVHEVVRQRLKPIAAVGVASRATKFDPMSVIEV